MQVEEVNVLRTSNGECRVERMLGVDLIRLFSVFMIFLFHSNIHVCKITYGVFTPFISMGAITMTTFYMISGFALYHVYRKQDYSSVSEIKKFYLKRIIGIIPVYYAVCVLFDIYQYRRTPITQLIARLPMDSLGIQSWFTGTFEYGHVAVTWFISCIMLSYFLFPFLVMIIRQLSIKEKIYLYVIITLVVIYAPFAQHALALSSIYSNPLFRLLEFILGMLLYAIILDKDLKYDSVIGKLRCWPVIALEFIIWIVGVTLVIKLGVFSEDCLLYNWLNIPIYTLMFISLSGKNISKNLEKIRAIPFLAKISYTFFLAQLFLWSPVKILLQLSGMDSNSARFILSFALCTMIAIFLHKVIEVPCKRILTKKIFK